MRPLGRTASPKPTEPTPLSPFVGQPCGESGRSERPGRSGVESQPVAVAAETLRRTPLFERHSAAGARLVPFAGWEMPVQYEGIRQEHVAVRTAAGLFDVSHMGQIETRGPDAEAFLQHILSNDLTKIADGGAQYSVLCRDDGGVLDDLFTYRLGERLLTVTNAANHDRDFAWFAAHPRSHDGASSSCRSRSRAPASRGGETRCTPIAAPASSRAAPTPPASRWGSGWRTSRERRPRRVLRSRSTSAASAAPPRCASGRCTAGRTVSGRRGLPARPALSPGARLGARGGRRGHVRDH